MRGPASLSGKIEPVIVKPSAFGYAVTAARLDKALSKRGLTVFARIDHAAAARGVDLELPPEEVLIFGSPRAGTPLMQRDPRIGYELPLRILLWQEGELVLLGYRDPVELAGDYEVGEGRANLERMAALLAELAAEAAG
ncbi:MAG: DUF302 domain-containing protein [Chloroflexi bacterium]|nr:MAG: DUF302 domain-containing protein [Chloroflexota bacterium]